MISKKGVVVVLTAAFIVAGINLVSYAGMPDAAVMKTVPAKTLPGPTFPHKAHLARKLVCTTCHAKPGGPLKAELNTKDGWHTACGGCHASNAKAPSPAKAEDCKICHK
ncbi:MAG: cytochrome c3 family protein [bacterium]|nr:cytochrome c3 family protein [bacterium]